MDPGHVGLVGHDNANQNVKIELADEESQLSNRAHSYMSGNGWRFSDGGLSSDCCGACALVFTFLSHLLAILPYLSSGYKPGSQGIFIEEILIVLLYSYDRLPHVLPPSLPA